MHASTHWIQLAVSSPGILVHIDFKANLGIFEIWQIIGAQGHLIWINEDALFNIKELTLELQTMPPCTNHVVPMGINNPTWQLPIYGFIWV